MQDLAGRSLSRHEATGSIHNILSSLHLQGGLAFLKVILRVVGVTFHSHGKVAQELGGFLATNSESLVSADFHPPQGKVWVSSKFLHRRKLK